MTNTPPKFPRTYHLPFSPGLQNDDRLHQNPERFVGPELVVTEKLDGGNTCIYKGEVYARSTGQPSKHPSFDYIKGNHVPRTFGTCDDLMLYGENLYAIHSIEYHSLPDYFFLFAVTDGERWYSWDEVCLVAESCGFRTTPEIFRGTVDSMRDLERRALLEEWDYGSHTEVRRRQSFFYGEFEGFVVREADEFPFDEYSERAAKYVRAGHIQTNEHWSKNWRAAQLASSQH
jgi:hypothetical protein